MFEGKLVLLAEDQGEPVGYAFGDLGPRGHAHVNIVYVVPERRLERHHGACRPPSASAPASRGSST